jgi:hypothetical protein
MGGLGGGRRKAEGARRRLALHLPKVGWGGWEVALRKAERLADGNRPSVDWRQSKMAGDMVYAFDHRHIIEQEDGMP